MLSNSCLKRNPLCKPELPAQRQVPPYFGDVWSHYRTLNEKGEAVDRGRFRTSPKGVTDLPPARVPWEASSASSEVVCNTLGIIAGRSRDERVTCQC